MKKIVHISGSCHDSDSLSIREEGKEDINVRIAGIDSKVGTCDYEIEERWIIINHLKTLKHTDLYERHCGASGQRYFTHYEIEDFDIEDILKKGNLMTEQDQDLWEDDMEHMCEDCGTVITPYDTECGECGAELDTRHLIYSDFYQGLEYE